MESISKSVIDNALIRARARIAILLTEYARSHHKYVSRTGNLKKATTFIVSNDKVIGLIRDNASYGYKLMKNDPFLEDAITFNQDKIDMIIDEEIARGIRYGR